MNVRLEHKGLIFPPGALGQVHASTLLLLPDGSFLAAWFAGTKEGASDVSIYGAKFANGKWSSPLRWAKVDESAHWNPVLFALPDGTLMLFFKIGVSCDVWATWVCHSSDEGCTWSSAQELVKGDMGGRGPVKNKPIILSSGAILAPASLELDGLWRCFVDRSDDGGKTWTENREVPMDRKEIPGKGAIQPTLWESTPKHVHMLARTSGGFIYRSDSIDDGHTWSQFRKTDLLNNNSGIDLDRDAAGNLLLAYNPVGKDWGPRTPLTLGISEDNGTTWRKTGDLETDDGEYSYPAVIATPEGFAGTYTWRRESIAFWQAEAL